MRNRDNSSIPSNLILIIFTIICVVLLFVNYSTGFAGGPLKTVANYIFVPMQKGLDYIGSNISKSNEEAKTKEELIAENKQLEEKIEDLTKQLNDIQLKENELEDLQKLHKLGKTYKDYKTTGAHIIAKGTSNWFNTFTIDKGTSDGIKKDMNVIAGSGLVGIVTEAGTHYAVVRAIIDDTNNVSGMIVDTSDNCIISGNLELMTQSNMIEIKTLEDPDDEVDSGDAVVTSNISDKYLPGLLIGYVDKLEGDKNDLTKSGTITPVVDFKHLKMVLVIMETKKTKD